MISSSLLLILTGDYRPLIRIWGTANGTPLTRTSRQDAYEEAFNVLHTFRCKVQDLVHFVFWTILDADNFELLLLKYKVVFE